VRFICSQGNSNHILQVDEDDDGHVMPEDNPYHLLVLEGHTGAVRALDGYGRTCVSGSYDTTVRVWDLITGQCKHVFTGHDQKGELRSNQCSIWC
jgi:F-box and WD-40 domain protein CDC4